VSKTFTIVSAGPKAGKAADAEDIAARYLVYKLYDATRDKAGPWQNLRAFGEPKAIVDRAVERGWVIVRQDSEGRVKVFRASLTVEGRRLAVRRASIKQW
jgi:hypothetical protein